MSWVISPTSLSLLLTLYGRLLHRIVLRNRCDHLCRGLGMAHTTTQLKEQSRDSSWDPHYLAHTSTMCTYLFVISGFPFSNIHIFFFLWCCGFLLLFCSVRLRLSLKLADFPFYISEFDLELPQYWGYRYGATMPDFALGHALMRGCLCSCRHFLSQCELSESRIQV